MVKRRKNNTKKKRNGKGFKKTARKPEKSMLQRNMRRVLRS